MILDGFTFTPAPSGDGTAEEAFARFVIHNRHIGFGRMIQIVGGLWDQVPGVQGMGTAHVEAAMKGKRKRRVK